MVITTIVVNGQGNFMFNQHSSDTECQYGDLSNYTNIICYYSYSNPSTGYTDDFTDIGNIKLCLDTSRNLLGGQFLGYNYYAAFKNYDIGSNVLSFDGQEIICELKLTTNKYYVVAPNNLAYNAIILKFTYGIITHSEIY